MKILVRLGADLVIKSDRVRSRFQARMIKNMKFGFKRAGVTVDIETKWARLFVNVDDADVQIAKEILLNTFGISSLSLVEHICEPTVDAIAAAGGEFYKDAVVGKKFRISARRAGVGGFNSLDVNKALGGALYSFSDGVNLNNPDINISVEIHPEGAMFFSEIIQGTAGLPLGSGGKALCLISGGFDSVVAAYLMMRRGIDMDFLFCNLAGKAYERSVINVTRFFFERFCHGSYGRMYIVDYTDIVEEIKKRVRPAYAQVILKRMFYRTAEKLGRELECQALVTGEAVAQVSSQTLQNLIAIESCIETPGLRPLVGFDKSDIIKYAREIGTFDLCAVIQEYCQLVPNRPVTAAPVAKADEEEAKVNLELIDAALDGKQKLHLGKITDADLNTSYLFMDEIPDDAVVIDIRTAEEYEEWHHPRAKNLEWAELIKGFSKLDKSATYTLYCPHGLQSVVIAEKMQSEGYEAYSLRGGTRSIKRS